MFPIKDSLAFLYTEEAWCFVLFLTMTEENGKHSETFSRNSF